ncbi:MAG TPA: hypothetical protein VKD72_12415, partial [Gemmataceae bacterium]|nr:hypothetical protein [Gemmataceae bacterium]
MILSTRLLPLVYLFLASSTHAADRPRLDAHGDPLPEGAFARLGTIRFRGLIGAVTLSPDGRMIATIDGQSSLRLLDAASGKTLKVFRLEEGAGHATVAFSPDGKVLAALVSSGRIRLWSVTTGKALGDIDTAKTQLSSVAFSGDGRLLTAASDQLVGEHRTIRVWEVATRKLLTAVEPIHSQEVFSTLAGDGKRLATWGRVATVGNRDDAERRARTIQVWDTSSGKEVRKIEMPQGSVLSKVSLSRDGSRLVVCCGSQLRIWDVTTGKEVGQFAGRRATQSCFLSP